MGDCRNDHRARGGDGAVDRVGLPYGIARVVVCAVMVSILPASALASTRERAGEAALRFSTSVAPCPGPAAIHIPSPLSNLANIGILLLARANVKCSFDVVADGNPARASVPPRLPILPAIEDTAQDTVAAPPSAGFPLDSDAPAKERSISRSVSRSLGQSTGQPSQAKAPGGDWQPAGADSGLTHVSLSDAKPGPQPEYPDTSSATENRTGFDPATLFEAGLLAACVVLLIIGLRYVGAVVFSERAVLARAAASGLRRKEFSLDYQPIVYLRTQKCVGLKVNVRWNNARHGLQGAGHFMEKLQGSDVAKRIQAFAISRACEDLDGVPSCKSLYVAVDGWTACLGDRTNMNRIAELAGKFTNTRFVLQVLADTLPEMLDVLLTLRKLGVRVGISGFTAGAVSAEALVDLRPAYLKVHRSVMTLPKEERYRTLHDVARIGRRLDIATIANGVESALQLHVATSANVPFAQGFLLGRAMSVDRLRTFIETAGNAPDN